jgi:hypothetical protein
MKITSKISRSDEIALGKFYVLAEHWKSDLEFYKDELNFLSSLINKYFLWLIKDQELPKIQLVAARLDKNVKTRAELSKKTINYMSDIKEMMDYSLKQGDKKLDKQLEEQHEKLEEDMTLFMKNFRALKKDIFSITEAVMEQEKVKRLISQ